MRLLVLLTWTVALSTGCGVTLDFDPASDLGANGMDGSAADLGAGDASIDAGARDGGPSNDGATNDLPASDALVDGCVTRTCVCTSDGDCSGSGPQFCAFPDTICGGTGVCMLVPSACTTIAMPVCGCDGMDYGNPCEAARARVSVGALGPCVRSDGGIDACAVIATLERGCTSDSSCAVGIHQSDCCGNTVALGLNHAILPEFDALEAMCDATYPICGCPVGPTTTDSGETAFDTTAIQVACVVSGGVGTCMTYVTMRPPGG